MPPRVATTKPGPPPPGQLKIIGEKCLAFVRENATAGEPKSVLEAIDTFGYEHHWMMNVGDVKGELVDQEIAKVKPKVLVELGGLFGYSAVRFASQMRELSRPSVHVYSFEISPDFAAIAMEMVEFAGLSNIVTIFVGTFGDNFTKLKELGVDHVDVFFLDHDKKCYKSDLQIIEQSGLLRSGSVVMADNVVVAHITDYLEYVRAHKNFNSVMYDSYLEYSDIKDALEVSTYVA
ncbi:hypothetical protein PF005_g14877 [Phytophthora fragariae]|uniref:catechol O-methyltransferase n=1 Tax=Phytophthora fragariae TaxID=53985 RepID=A0A6A3RNS8_9STRA|nr:hypothetical protein PF003_g34957 [Phytophthora fragariae]KAE8933789.1 hypothetical protein PF009_g16211 [Phytophthora fragariae]KAE9001029.1 hypothetical protein PF011_g13926 [Phytophthora fragariae]KAE9101058.1 hypothetical protein PF007_g15290 [Phytophthora fragariae]KAE9101247.1 hypothetical protein PF010_g14516 [Phytophthora fragariae]